MTLTKKIIAGAIFAIAIAVTGAAIDVTIKTVSHVVAGMPAIDLVRWSTVCPDAVTDGVCIPVLPLLFSLLSKFALGIGLFLLGLNLMHGESIKKALIFVSVVMVVIIGLLVVQVNKISHTAPNQQGNVPRLLLTF
jgi:hypothetical protein